MNMKSWVGWACLGVAFLTLNACEEDEHVCTLPAFAGFRIEPLVWNPGDSVTITAVQSSLGNLLFKAEYQWRVECQDTTFSKDDDVVYDADKSDPYIGIRLPSDFTGNRAVIRFSVQYSYSATAPTSAPAGIRGEGLYGSITTLPASQLWGSGSGTYTHSWYVCTLPAFAGFRIEPLVWNPGDSVTITAVQSSLGNLLFKAEYQWRVECQDTTFSKDDDVVYDADKSDPYIGIRLPSDFTGNRAVIRFSVQYSYSATAPTSAPAGIRGEGLYGSITTLPASQLWGSGSGTYTHSW